MINFRLTIALIAAGLIATSVNVSAQERPVDSESGYSVVRLTDLERYGIFANCKDNTAHVDEAIFVPPADGAANGIIYNACMSSNTSSCGTYENGKLVSIPQGCIDSARNICSFAANMKF